MVDCEAYLIKDAFIVNEGKILVGSLFIKNQLIEEVFYKKNFTIPQTNHIIDAKGKYLFPGIIDCHVHFREPGLTQKGDFATESKAAIAGGVTSIMDMPNTQPNTTDKQSLKEKIEIAKKKSLVNYSFYLGATNNNLQEIISIDKTNICGIKLFLGSSTGNMLINDDNIIESIFKNIKIPIVAHCEDEEEIKSNLERATQNNSDYIPFEMHPVIRSEESVAKSLSKVINLAKKYSTKLHLLHVSTAAELEILKNLSELEKTHISSEVGVHYLLFNSNSYKELKGNLKVNPPIRDTQTQTLLQRALKNNIINIISTDHAPHLLSEKNNSYITCPSGAPSIQHSLASMIYLFRKNIISLELIADKMCHQPANIFNIKNRGYIKKGYYADFCIVDLENNLKNKHTKTLYKCGWSNFDTLNIHSVVTHTFVNGTLAFNNGRFSNNINALPLEFLR